MTSEDLSTVVERYDELGGGEFDRFEREGTRGALVYELEREILLEHTDPGDTVLDAGGGSGKFAIPLAENGRNVDLVDVSHSQCEHGRKNVAEHGVDDRVNVSRGDVRNLEFLPRDRYDVVVCIGGALSHVRSDADLALEQLRRVGTDGCTLVTSAMSRTVHNNDLYSTLSTNSGDELRERLRSLADEKTSRQGEYEDIGSFRKYSSEELSDLLRDHGFRVEETYAIDRHAKAMEFPISGAWEDPETREALLEYEMRVASQPWYADSGNMVLKIANAE